MKKQFVTYEIALKLKELGFDEECWFYFSPLTKELMCHSLIDERNSTYKHKEVSTPLWQQVIDWFREKYNISTAIDMNCMEDSGFVFYLGNMNNRTTIFESYTHFNTYQEAREQAILKVIELCQGKIKIIWLEYCKTCKKKHFVTMKKCPDCGVHETAQPVFETVAENCNANYRCDGCDAYLDHLC